MSKRKPAPGAPEYDWIAEQLRPLAIEVEALAPDPANARKHDARNLAAIRSSLAAYGQRKPVVVRREGMIVTAGNGTLEAAKALGWTHVAAVLVDDDATTATGYAIADNRTAELAEWDGAVLAQLLGALQADEIPLEEVGFSDLELAALIGGPAAPPPPSEADETAPPAPDDPVSRRGEVYQLGPHRLMCGDSTSAEDVARLLDGATPQLMVTDPPYGVNYDPEWRRESGLNNGGRLGAVTNDDRADWREAWALFLGGVAYVYHSNYASPEVAASLEAARFERRALICWAKTRFAIGRGHYHHQHEPCWYAVRKGQTAEWIGDRSQTTLWTITLDKNVEGGHSTQKPVECMERPIRNHSGDVYDPFLGSGTTLIAAARQGRTCYGMEVSPAYCDVIRKRWGTWARANGRDPGPGAL